MKKYFEYMKNNKSGNFDVWGSFYNTVVGACRVGMPNGEDVYDLEAMTEFFRDAVSENGSKVDMIKSFRFGSRSFELADKILELFPSKTAKGIEDLNRLFKELFEEDSVFAKNVVENFMLQKIDKPGSDKYNQICSFKAQMFVDYLDVTSDPNKAFIFKSQNEVIEKVKALGVLLVKPPAFKILSEEIHQKPLAKVVTNPGIVASRILNLNTDELLETVKSGDVYKKENIPVLALLLRKDSSEDFYNAVKAIGGKEIIDAAVEAVRTEGGERHSSSIMVLESSEHLWKDVVKEFLEKTPKDLAYSSGLRSVLFSNVPLTTDVKKLEEDIRLMSTYIFGSDDYKDETSLRSGKIGTTLEFTRSYLNAVLKSASEKLEENPPAVTKLVSEFLNNDYCRELVTATWGKDLYNLGMSGMMLQRVGAEKIKSDIYLASDSNMQSSMVKFFILAGKVKENLSNEDVVKLENLRLSMVEDIWTQRSQTYVSDKKTVVNLFECINPSLYAISISDETIPKIQELIKARTKEQMENLFDSVEWLKKFADKNGAWGGFRVQDEEPLNGREMMFKLILSDPEVTSKFKEGKSTVIKQLLLNNQEAFLNFIRENDDLVPLLEKNKEIQRNIAQFEPGLSERTFAVFLEHKILLKSAKNQAQDIDFADVPKL